MPGALTEITEITTALGTLTPDLATAFARRPARLQNVSDGVWRRVSDAYRAGDHPASFDRAFANGRAFLAADDDLRGRPPMLVEWKGPHRPPGDDVIPADLRIDHVYQVSCKYLSRVLQNPGPARLFDRLLVGEGRARADWFEVVAPAEYEAFYAAVRDMVGADLPARLAELTREDRHRVRAALRSRSLPAELVPSWRALCDVVSARSAERWKASLASPRMEVRLLWRLLRIADAPYFVLGTDGRADIRLRVASAWDWVQAYELRSFDVAPRHRGQPEVEWRAVIRRRYHGDEITTEGHVEIRWSHGRLQGSPEAKVYLDTPLEAVPGYFPLE